MAADTVTLALQGDVSLEQFSEAVVRFNGLVRALSEEARLQDVVWRIDDLIASSAVATARGVSTNGTAPDEIGRVVRSFLEIGQSLEVGKPVPYPPPVRTEAQGIVALLKKGVEAVRFETAESDAVVREFVAEAAPLPSRTLVEGYGAVTGRVQTLTSRSQLRFTLYDRLHDRAVSCYLAEGRESLMREMWDRIATVEGWVTRDPESGRPLAVRRITKVTPVTEVHPGDYLAAKASARRTKESPETTIRRLRDAW